MHPLEVLEPQAIQLVCSSRLEEGSVNLNLAKYDPAVRNAAERTFELDSLWGLASLLHRPCPAVLPHAYVWVAITQWTSNS